MIPLHDQRLELSQAISEGAHLPDEVQVHAVLGAANESGQVRLCVALRGQLVEEGVPDISTCEQVLLISRGPSPCRASRTRPESVGLGVNAYVPAPMPDRNVPSKVSVPASRRMAELRQPAGAR